MWFSSFGFISLFSFVLTSDMHFVTDCDNTLVFYSNFTATQEDLIRLPASSGSGVEGFVSARNVNKLKEISRFATITCASGMRARTMLQRAPFFPDISYWICENGVI